MALRNLTTRNFRAGDPEDDLYEGHGIFVIDAAVALNDVTIEKYAKMGFTGRGSSSLTASGLRILDGHVAIWLEESAHLRLCNALVRNIDDFTGWLRLPTHTVELIGNVCLALILAVALMNLRLWELAGMGLPLLVNLVLQVGLVALFAVPVFWLMGRDYDAAVMGGGFIGFMLGTTANAMAVMRALVQRYGIAPRAFLVAPLVGAFFIDFSNALIITGFVNLWPH